MDNYNNRNSNSSIISFVLIIIIVVIGLFAFNIIPNPISNNSKDIAFIKKEIRLQKNDSIQLSLSKDSNNIKFKSSDEKIATINEDTGYIKGINNGTVTITAYDGNKVVDTCTVEVYEPGEVININSIKLSETKINLYVGNTKQLKVSITPSNATNKKIYWSTSNTNVATIDKNGNVKAVGVGTATIRVRTENDVIATCEVNVSKKSENAATTNPTNPTTNDTVNPTSNESTNPTSNNSTNSIPNKSTKTQIKKVIISKSKISVDVGKTSKLSYKIEPTNGYISSAKWTSSNTKIATVSADGTVKGIKAGNTEVTLTVNGSIKCKVTVTVNKNKTTNGKIWGYTDSEIDNKPKLADEAFFKKIVSNGRGSISNGVYSYSSYKYNFRNHVFTYNGGSVPIRIYYPKDLDLSNVNTFTFFGGTGEIRFGGFFSEVYNNTSLIKSGGIVILVGSYANDYQYKDAINATNFVKAIVKQKSGKKNSIGGYSGGGPAASEAMVNGKYDRLILVNSNFPTYKSNLVSDTAKKLKDKKIYIYSPKNDHMREKTQLTLDALVNAKAGKNVTLISNNNELINRYKKNFTIINPGDEQGSGHDSKTFTNKGNIFAFACSD